MKKKVVEKLLDDMIEFQLISRGIDNMDVLAAFNKVQRHFFISKVFWNQAYSDFPLDIGFGQTISQPYIVALSLQSAKILKTDRVLEIGTGSGYQTALLAEMAKEVYTVEIIPDLLEKAKLALTSLSYVNIHFLNGNGYLGWNDFAPYDKIIVSAAAYYLPSALVDQLKPGGKLVIPIDTKGWQELVCLTKDAFGLRREKLCDCRFVPLING